MATNIELIGAGSAFLYSTWTILISGLLGAAFILRFFSQPSIMTELEPPSLADPIPFVYNTLQFVFSKKRFFERVREALVKSSIVRFSLAGNSVYVCGGPKNNQAILSSRELTYNGIMVQIGFPRLWRMTKEEVKRFEYDNSGHRELPLPGYEHVPSEHRYWARKYHVLYEFLSRPHHIKPVVDEFASRFIQVVEKFPVGEWTRLSIDELTRRDFTQCAITTLFGPKIFEINPNFLDAFWEFDSYASVLVYGLPEWMYPAPYRASNRFLGMIEKYVAAGLVNFDWEGDATEAQWEPHFGTRITRDLVKWLTDAGFRRKSVAGSLATLLFGQNSNSIPVVSWILIELNRDPELLKAIREEVATAFVAEPSTGRYRLDNQKLVSLPLLQSLFTEVLRLRVSMVIMRVVEKPTIIDGITIPTGSLLHTYSEIAQTDERTWGERAHPASRFWPERHIKFVEAKDEKGEIYQKREFALAAGSGNFFPFGGGVPMCPGRHFAKYEIFTMVALLVHHFDMEFVEWVKMDGSPSDRGAQGDEGFSGIGTLPPDRDMIVIWKRLI